MAKLPIIDVNPEVGGAVGQQKADLEDFVPGWRQVDSAIRAGGQAQGEVFQGSEAAALAQQREALSSGAIGEAIQNTADPLEKRFKQMDMSAQQVTASRLHMQWAKHAMDRIKAGDVHDPNLTDSFLEDFDKNTADTVNNAQTDEGKFYLTHALAEMRAQFGTQVMVGQSERAGLQIKQDATELVNNRSETARMNISMVPQLLSDHKRDMLNTAAMLGGDSGKAAELIEQGNKAISTAGIEGQIMTNPQLVKAQLALQPADRDPNYKAMSPYIGGVLGNTLAEHADSRIKLLAHEAREKAVSDREQRKEANEQLAGGVSNAIDKRSDTLADGKTRVIDAIQKMKTSPGGYYLGVGLEEQLKASALQGARIVGDSATEVKMLNAVYGPKSPTVTDLAHMVGTTDAGGKANGISPQWFEMLQGEIRRRDAPETAMNQQIKHSFLASVEAKFKAAETQFKGTDTAGYVQSQHTKYLIAFSRDFESRVDNGEHAIDILDDKKAGSLAQKYRSFLPTAADLGKMRQYAADNKVMPAEDAAAAMGMPNPGGFGRMAVSVAADALLPESTSGSKALVQATKTAASELAGEVAAPVAWAEYKLYRLLGGRKSREDWEKAQ